LPNQIFALLGDIDVLNYE